MTDKPKLVVIEGGGGQDAIARRLFKILLRSTTRPKMMKDADLAEQEDQAEMDALHALLDRHGDLSLVHGERQSATDANPDQQPTGESE
jgi:hypothetical protein